jgi:hypothetical protein
VALHCQPAPPTGAFMPPNRSDVLALTQAIPIRCIQGNQAGGARHALCRQEQQAGGRAGGEVRRGVGLVPGRHRVHREVGRRAAQARAVPASTAIATSVTPVAVVAITAARSLRPRAAAPEDGRDVAPASDLARAGATSRPTL